MSNESDKLKELIDDSSESAEDIQTSIDNVQSQIDELTEQQEAFEFVMDNCCNDLEDILLLPKGEFIYTFGNFRISNAIDWYVCDTELSNDDTDPSNDATYVSSTVFECDGDQTSIFSTDQEVVFVDGTSVIVYSTVSTSTFNTGKTTVELNSAVVPNPIHIVALPVYVYNGIGWDNDVDIQDRIDEFDFAYDYITNPLGTGGTYGTQAMIASLTDAKGLLTANKNKIVDSETKLARYSA